MVTLVVLALFASATSRVDCKGARDASAPTLVVQAVDELWLPLPGALVTARGREKDGESASGTADGEGFARLSITKRGVYDVEASMVGFKTARVRKIGVDADPCESIPHVQVKLKVAAPKDIIM